MSERRPFLPSQIAALRSVAGLLDDDAYDLMLRRNRMASSSLCDEARSKCDARRLALSAEAITLRAIAKRGAP